MVRLLPLAALALLLAACDTSAPDGAVTPGAYQLASVDGRPLPATVERTEEVCSSDAAREYHWVVEAQGGTLTVAADGSVRVVVDRERVCEDDGAARTPRRVEVSGRVEGDGLDVAAPSGRLGSVVVASGTLTVSSTGFGLGPASRELRFVGGDGPVEHAGLWTGSATFELDTTYAYRTTPDVLRRQQLYRRFDLTLDLRVQGDSVVGTGRYVSVFERISTNLQTGSVQTVGGRDVQQEDVTFPVRGTRDGRVVELSFYGRGVLLDWRGHPLVLDGGVLRTGVRNYFDGGYFSAPAADVPFVRG